MMPVLGAPRAKRRAPRLAYIKSLAPLFCAFIAFTLALTSYAFLSQIRSPAAVHHLGWQAWEAIEIDSDSNATTTTTASLRLDVWVR
jgi:hypothetical protein